LNAIKKCKSDGKVGEKRKKDFPGSFQLLRGKLFALLSVRGQRLPPNLKFKRLREYRRTALVLRLSFDWTRRLLPVAELWLFCPVVKISEAFREVLSREADSSKRHG